MTAWEHAALLLGACIAIAIGAADAMIRQRLGIAFDVALIVGGLAALGVKATGVLPS